MHRLLLQIQLRVLFHILKQFPDFGEHQDNSWMKGRNDSQTSRLSFGETNITYISCFLVPILRRVIHHPVIEVFARFSLAFNLLFSLRFHFDFFCNFFYFNFEITDNFSFESSFTLLLERNFEKKMKTYK